MLLTLLAIWSAWWRGWCIDCVTCDPHLYQLGGVGGWQAYIHEMTFLDQFHNCMALNTIGNCQRPVFSLDVSQHMHTKQNCENLSSFGHRSCDIIMKEKTPLSNEVVCFQILDFETSNSKSEVSKSNSWKIAFFLKTIRHFRGSRFSQPLRMTRYQVRFYNSYYFELLPIVSTAFKTPKWDITWSVLMMFTFLT